MKILVFADSHRDVDTMHDAVQRLRPDAAVHLGDHIVDAVLLGARHRGLPLHMVAGNCDVEAGRPKECTVSLGGVPFFLAHGDAHGVDAGPEHIIKAGREAGARVVLHGHTHKPMLACVGGVAVMNPGRIGRVSSKKIDATFGVIDIRCDVVHFSLISYDTFEQIAGLEGTVHVPVDLYPGSPTL